MIRPTNEALIMIDIQNDFCPGGALAVARGDEIVPLVNKLQSEFAVKILTQDWHPQQHLSFADNHNEKSHYDMVDMSYGPQVLWPAHCMQGTYGAEFHKDLITDDADLIVRKGFHPHIDSYSAFYENDHTTPTGLKGYLRERGIEKLHMAGLATDFCVRFSAVDAAKQGFKVTVHLDACRAIDLNGSLKEALTDMQNHGVIFTGELVSQ
ncbi:bifunctional nicotinamidase/pyrazinamidase [Pseudovibrio sp. Tun.PSC04-5.I4]|uniref:bifunctional nicotinamidase/pyrazinamidase n=1 Tax=Pseudovibrio sp. Tun.PSC04-5.I4 TaxID=1798213 RepID=UPI00088FA9D5|nr:bifunctional nicotinamidase/pyrazinamidase [Pseudovibrio sp. Tun.PSC04-5.I4]SDQ76144.1 nicotinamidase/pyrazinamidase [Pseudovibrio sp. Tun.PSC04-5.I4]